MVTKKVVKAVVSLLLSVVLFSGVGCAPLAKQYLKTRGYVENAVNEYYGIEEQEAIIIRLRNSKCKNTESEKCCQHQQFCFKNEKL